ncbi:hypothetical protein OC834_000163 [Tilletia horrida]|uniref:Prefoldin subunit 1 n=1 Tax=Tilletia horrida TaxID=155126 RepID=A0AAN6G7J1_9BASI|nr:hypothetical protein OC842_005656 [Tilletia horrida]KAK0539160.1 hypothetical protein OC834_000163 [Tilletia horrida]
MSQQEEALHKVLQQIQTQYVVSQRQLNGVRAQLQVRERERRGAELTLKQIDEVDPEAKFYKGVGKMFIMEDRNTVRSELVSREKEWKEDIANLTKKQKFLEKQVSDAQGHLNDIFRASQASSSSSTAARPAALTTIKTLSMMRSDTVVEASGDDAPLPPPAHRKWITAAAIAASSLTAGSIFCFPLFSPSLTHDLDLTLKQTSSIWAGAVLGEYGFAAPAGIIADRFGPRVLCLVASLLFFFGYTMMGREEAVAVAARAVRDGAGLGLGSIPGDVLRNTTQLLVSAAADTGAPIAPKQASYVRLAFAFFLCGAGVSASYFSAVTAATRTFPNFPSLAIALPLTLFSLSSMLLSAVGSYFFADPVTGDLETSAFLFFLAYMLGVVNLVAGLGMHNYKPVSPPSTPERRLSVAVDADEASASTSSQATASRANGTANEHTPLIASELRPSRSALPFLPKDSSLKSFLCAPSVWAIALLMFIAVGACEMLMSCVGSVVQSLLGAEPGEEQQNGLPSPGSFALTALSALASASPSAPTRDWRRAALAIRGSQIRLLSTMNTVSRLGSGLLADLCAPTSTRVQSARRQGRRPFVLSRLTVILAALGLLFVAFSYAALGFPPTSSGPTPLPAPPSTFIRLSLVSISTGLSYGIVFTLAPSILSSIFDVAKFGRNWGLLSYACAAGSLVYTMMYASISDWVAENAARAHELLAKYADTLGIELVRASQQQQTGSACLMGPKCFQLTFVISAASILVAIAAVLPLWRSWRHAL